MEVKSELKKYFLLDHRGAGSQACDCKVTVVISFPTRGKKLLSIYIKGLVLTD